MLAIYTDLVFNSSKALYLRSDKLNLFIRLWHLLGVPFKGHGRVCAGQGRAFRYSTSTNVADQD